jgi:hypothetical protein
VPNKFGHVKPNLTVYFLVAAQGSHPNLFHSESDDHKLYVLLIKLLLILHFG